MTKKIIISLESSAKKPYKITLFLDESWNFYWQKSLTQHLLVLQALVTQLINQPYIDNPDLLEKIHNIVVYRPNHDAAHALRQYTLMDLLFEIMVRQGNQETRETIKALTEEEKHLALLASFLFRCGRTNEDSSTLGLTQNNRSAQIFQQIAFALGYSHDLVQSMAALIENYIPVNDVARLKALSTQGFSGENSEIINNKVKLINGLLLLSHHSDLVRCWSSLNDIQVNNLDNLTAFFPAGEVGSIHHFLLHFAKAACIWTGTDFFLHEQKGNDLYTSPKVYKAQCIADLETAFKRMQALKRNWLTRLPVLDFGHILNHYHDALKLNLPTEQKAAITLHKWFMASQAKDIYEPILGVNPYQQSIVSVTRLYEKLRRTTQLTPAEIASQNQIGMTTLEQRAYKELLDFPWTLKHSTRYMDEIMATGYIYSSNKLQKTGLNRTHTNTVEGVKDYVLLSLGSPKHQGFKTHEMGLDSFSIPAALFQNEQGELTGSLANIISTSPSYYHLEGHRA